MEATGSGMNGLLDFCIRLIKDGKAFSNKASASTSAAWISKIEGTELALLVGTAIFLVRSANGANGWNGDGHGA